MTTKERAQINDILDALVKLNRRNTVSDAARIVYQARNRTADLNVKELLTKLGEEIETLSPDYTPPTKGSPDAVPASDRSSSPGAG